ARPRPGRIGGEARYSNRLDRWRRRIEADLFLARGQADVHLGQQLGIEQRAMQLAMRVVDTEPSAQRVERVALPGEPLAREQQRVLDPATVAQAAVGGAGHPQLVV